MTKGFRAKSLGEVDREIATEVCFTQGFRAKYMGEVDPEVPLPLPPPQPHANPATGNESVGPAGGVGQVLPKRQLLRSRPQKAEHF